MGSHNRRRSISSSSSSSSSGSDREKKWKKKDKKDKHGEKKGHPSEGAKHGMPSPPGQPSIPGHGAPLGVPAFPIPGGAHDAGYLAMPGVQSLANSTRGPSPGPGGQFPSPGHGASGAPGGGQAPPPSGFRVPLTDTVAFPSQQAGQPVAYDADGRTPVFVGSALMGNAVHPCKIVPTFSPPARVAYGGAEIEHRGRYDLLPFDPVTMEWVPTAHGQIPHGRRPVEGGYEETGGKLYHALATVQGVRVPGKTGTHLNGANVPFGGQEHVVDRDYAILCWRF